MSSDVGAGTTTWENPPHARRQHPGHVHAGRPLPPSPVQCRWAKGGRTPKILTTDGAGQNRVRRGRPAREADRPPTYGHHQDELRGRLVLKADNTWQGESSVQSRAAPLSVYKAGCPAGGRARGVRGRRRGRRLPGRRRQRHAGTTCSAAPGTINVHTGSLTLTGDSSAYTGVSYDRSELTVNGKLAGALGAYRTAARRAGRVGGTAVEGQGRGQHHQRRGCCSRAPPTTTSVRSRRAAGPTWPGALAAATAARTWSTSSTPTARRAWATTASRRSASGTNVTVDAVPAPPSVAQAAVVRRTSRPTRPTSRQQQDLPLARRRPGSRGRSRGSLPAGSRWTPPASPTRCPVARWRRGWPTDGKATRRGVHAVRRLQQGAGGRRRRRRLRQGHQADGGLGDGRRTAGRLRVQGRRRRPGSATNVLLATVPATSETDYSYDWTIDQGPSAGWHVSVQLWSARRRGGPVPHPGQPDLRHPAGELHHHGGPGRPRRHHTRHGLRCRVCRQDVHHHAGPGYHVSDVTVDDVSKGAITSYEFKHVCVDHTIRATFAMDTYAIEPSVVGGAWPRHHRPQRRPDRGPRRDADVRVQPAGRVPRQGGQGRRSGRRDDAAMIHVPGGVQGTTRSASSSRSTST